MEDLIIIGAGPAGLTSAIYGARAGKKVLVLEKIAYGGKIVSANLVENYPGIKSISGFDFARDLYEQTKSLGAEIKFEKVVDVIDKGDYKEVVTNESTYQAKAVIIATGVENRKLELPMEKELTGKGISYCATCDGAFYKGKTVAVYGGGNTAISDALFLCDHASKVYVIYRKENLRAEKVQVDKLKSHENVEILYNSVITKINGDEKLDSITINDEKELPIDGLFVAIGQEPNDDIKDIIETNEQGYIIGDESCHTNVPGIYVAGDVRVKEVRQLTTAEADGTIAALTAIKEMK